MGRNPMSPHTIKEILRLFFSEHSYGQIETKLHISKSAANRYVKRALTIGLTWDVIRDTPAAELAKQLAKTDDLSERWFKKLNLSSPPGMSLTSADAISGPEQKVVHKRLNIGMKLILLQIWLESCANGRGSYRRSKSHPIYE